MILLTTTGAQSGREHTVPLGNLSDDPSRVIVGGGFLRGPQAATAVVAEGVHRARIAEQVRAGGRGVHTDLPHDRTGRVGGPPTVCLTAGSRCRVARSSRRPINRNR
ncbi:hypothetical protein [Nocardia vulneris]|uniref:hypothetical protein n=1 Tax=Nocardia vulneris TaxID=1141657 RepID=UPI003BB1482E